MTSAALLSSCLNRPVVCLSVTSRSNLSHRASVPLHSSKEFISAHGAISLRNAVSRGIQTPLQGPLQSGRRSNTPVVITRAAVTQGPKPTLPQLDAIWSKLISSLAKAAALFALAAALAMAAVAPAHAARSGGRMGGSSFSGRSFGSSYGASSSSFGSSFGGRSSFSGAGSFGGRGSSGMFGGGPYRSSFSTNSFFFSPFGMGMGYGYGYPMGGGGGLSSLLFWGVFAVIAVQVMRGVLDQSGSSSGELTSGSSSGERLSVAKVQVGLLASARDLQRDLERIAARADTSSAKGLHYVLQETVLALLRNPDYCIYAFAKSGIERSPEDAESRFNKLSLEERGKFQKETRVNVGGRTSTGRLSGSGGGGRNGNPISELIVVTILVAAEGRLKLPRTTSRMELKEALTSLGAVPAEDVLAVEVLWTPEEEGDYFTQEDLAMDYPLLNTL